MVCLIPFNTERNPITFTKEKQNNINSHFLYDDLLAELEEMEQAELDTQLLDVETSETIFNSISNIAKRCYGFDLFFILV